MRFLSYDSIYNRKSLNHNKIKGLTKAMCYITLIKSYIIHILSLLVFY
jgi:hypothetical protein